MWVCTDCHLRNWDDAALCFNCAKSRPLRDIRFQCSQCQCSLVVSEDGAGLAVTCPHCSAPIVIPTSLKAGALDEKSRNGAIASCKKSTMVSCRICERQVSPSALSCPHCGEFRPALELSCPYCSSARILVSERAHFGFGKATTGAVLFGPAGLLAGLLPTKSLFFYCQDCGKDFT